MSYPHFKSLCVLLLMFVLDCWLLVVSGVTTHATSSVAAKKGVKPFVHAEQVQNSAQRHVPKPREQSATFGALVGQFQD